jgi:hypothetical protein
MPKMKIYLAFLLLILALPLEAAEIKDLRAEVREKKIMVSASLSLDKNQVDAIMDGGSKEITFYFDLFRGWRVWPDEFILGKTFTQTLRCDHVKKEYIAQSLSGFKLREKRFTNCRSLIEWALHIPEFQLTNTSELDPAPYKVKATVESRLRRLPPFINLLFFFVKETEFEVSKDSIYFQIEGAP